MPEPPKPQVSMPLSTPNDMLSGMAPVRKRLIVEGHVQGVGYRALVTLHARDLKIKGFVRNLPDETVEIICEGESEALTKFIQTIDRKGDPADLFSLNVVSIKEAPAAPEGELTRFYTDYGRKLTEIQRQTFDREEIMVYRGGTLNSNVGVVGKNVMEVGQKVDGVGQKIDAMHSDMNKRFDNMAQRYDLIATSLVKAIDRMDHGFERMDRNFERSRKETAAELKRSRKEAAQTSKEVAASNRELAKAVTFMMKKLSGRPATTSRGTHKKKK